MNGNGEREVVVVGAGEDLDEIARMAAGGAPVAGGAHYVSLAEFGRGSFFEPEAGGEALPADAGLPPLGAGGLDEGARDDERGGDLLGEATYVDGEDELRALRERMARERHVAVNGAPEDDGGAAPQAGDEGIVQRLQQAVKPQGKTNRRAVLVGLVVFMAFAVFVFGSVTRGRKKAANDKGADAAASAEQPDSKKGDAMRVRTGGGDTLRSTEEIGGGAKAYGGGLTSTDPSQTGTQVTAGQPPHNPMLERTTPASYVAPAPAGGPSVRSSFGGPARQAGAEAYEQQPVEQRRGGGPAGGGQYAVQRPNDDEVREREQPSRSRSQSARDEEKGKAPAANTVRLPAGTRIPMVLLEPLQTGIATTADARALADIRDAQGNILIPRGSIISIPFLAVHSNGRMMNDAAEEIEFRTSGGAVLLMSGSVKGPDGYVGIAGVVTKKGGGSTIGGVLKGVARGGARAAGRVIGQVDPTGVSSDAVSEAGIQSAVEGRYGNRGAAQREVVNVAAGLEFTFVVGK